MNRWSWHVPILLCGIAAVVLPLSGCSRGDNIDLNNLEANHVALNVEGMT